jgi:hypothetical protein
MTDLLLDAYQTISWEIFPSLVKQLVAINKENVEGELQELPQIYAYYYGLMSVAKRDLNSAESERDSLSATLRKTKFEEKIKSGEKATDKYLEAYINANDDFKNLQKQVIDCQFKYDLFKGLIESLSFKKDCLVQLSAQRRAEVKLMH